MPHVYLSEYTLGEDGGRDGTGKDGIGGVVVGTWKLKVERICKKYIDWFIWRIERK